MSNPGQFKDFSKSASDLLTKIFPRTIGENSWGFEYDLKPTAFVTGKAKLVNKGGEATAELEDDIRFDDFGFSLNSVFKTGSPSLDLALKITDKIPVDGLTAKLHLNAEGGSKSSQTAGVSLQFANENLTFNGRVYVPITRALINFVDESALADQDTRVDLDFVATHADYKVFLGGLAKLSFATSQQGAPRNLDEAQVRLGYRHADLNGSVGYKQTKKGSKETRSVNASVITKPGETSYVVDVEYDLDSKKPTVAAALEYPLNDGATVKAKLDTNKHVGLTYSNKFARGAELQFGTLLAVDTTGAAVALGSSFNFNLRFTQ